MHAPFMFDSTPRTSVVVRVSRSMAPVECGVLISVFGRVCLLVVNGSVLERNVSYWPALTSKQFAQ